MNQINTTTTLLLGALLVGGVVLAAGSASDPASASDAGVHGIRYELRHVGQAGELEPDAGGPILAEARRVLSDARDGGMVGEISRIIIFGCESCGESSAGLGIEAFDESGHASGALQLKAGAVPP